MWHQLIYKYCMSCHIHPLFLYAGKSEPREKSNVGLAPPTHNYVPVILNFLSVCRLARGAWILMPCSIPCTVYINLQKLERVCVSRHRRLGDTINVWKLLENYCYGKALLCRLSCFALISHGWGVHWSQTFSWLIPTKIGDGRRSSVGCTPLAMAE